MQSIQARLQTSLVTIAIFAVLLISLSPLLVQAQPQDPGPLQPSTDATAIPVYNQGVDESIKEFLCTPSDNPLEQGTALYDCIGKLYRFSLTAGAVVLVFFIVIAGYLYITGGESGKGKAKGIVLSALTGMGILLGSFALLNFINPQLVEIRTIQPPIFESKDLPSCEAIGFGSRCITGDGQVFNPGGTPGSASEAQYKDLITKYASQNGMEYCALSALIRKESTFNRLARSNPPGSINESAGPPTYGQSFADYHAIGLTQVTIYPQSKGGWVGGTPARSSPSDFGKSPLTLQMLLDPETNISAGAHYFGKLVRANSGNLRIAYDDFQSGPGDTGAPGKPDSDPKTLNIYMEMYNACKLRG